MRRGLLFSFLMSIAAASALPAAPVALAFLSIDNLSANPRYDYLEGIVRGVLLFDLANQEGLAVVNRGDLESILQEQELQLGSLAEDQGKALQVGKILGADYLLRGEYVSLGQEVQVTLRLLEVATARTLTFSERGASENMLHRLAEQIVERLTGRRVTFSSEEKERSILSLQDEKPGTIALHSHLVDAEIFLDGEFAGYTTGDMRVPFEIEDLRPGPHTVRIHLQHFGVVKEPEITFHDWEQTVEVKPGRRHVVRARARHFNEIVYDLQQLLRRRIDSEELAGGAEVRRSHDASFTDREARLVPISFEIAASRSQGVTRAQAVIVYDGQRQELRLEAGEGDRPETRRQVGKVEVILGIGGGEVRYEIWRTDIQQNMFD